MTQKNGLKKLFAVASAAVLTCGVAPSAVATSTSYIEGASVPFALAYGTCIYAEPGPADCAAVRDSLLAEADPILNRFYFADGLEARRSLRTLFDDMDRQAVKLRAQDKTLAPETLSFMGCVSDAIRNQKDFRRGVFISGSDAFRACKGNYDAYLARDRSTNSVQRNVNFMRYVKAILPNTSTGNQLIHDDGLLIERGPRG
ncbi:hypothetical protein KNJ79_13015 [Sphingopyxis indica]|uniref:hypothetical protein n=1 Tax=Sphingopyxis indica TaxID=436663 RepID=UPI00293931C8|nr:hypothetical protein [Sphingopyxis indica]WOF42131.1 hypothetical protein KNJ79_13015 [Sphingopyxis indica]